MAAWQVFDLQDVANGVLMYIAQAFLLAGSIFGLDYYVQRLNTLIHDKDKGNNAAEHRTAADASATDSH